MNKLFRKKRKKRNLKNGLKWGFFLLDNYRTISIGFFDKKVPKKLTNMRLETKKKLQFLVYYGIILLMR